TDRLARIIEKRVEKFRKSATPGQIDNFKNIVANVGTSSGNIGSSSSDSGSHTADLTMVFPDYEDRIKPSAEVIADVRHELEDFPGAEVKVEKRKEGPPTGSAVTVRIIGEDMGLLEKLSEEVAAKIKGTPNMVNMRSDLEAAKPELIFIPDRVQAAILETDTNSISQFLKTAIYGTKVGEYQQFNDDYDIRLRPAVSKRRGVDDLLKLRVPTLDGGAVPLTSLGQFEYRPGLGTIHRINRKRVVTITADAEGRPGLEVLADVQKKLADMQLPAGYRIEYAGEKEEDDKARAFLSKAFIIALLLIVAILVAQFNTLSVPLIIMSTVILSLIGVFVGLLIFRQPFGVVMTGVGVISLAGVVVNNAIVLLDYTRQLQQRGYTLKDAAVEAGITRLRPVLLTAGTTVLGLVPMVTGISFDFHTMSIAWRSSSSQWWSSMAVAVIFGLGCATMLTLLVVPSLYVLTSKIAEKMGMNTAPQIHHKSMPSYEDF
ncbi:MAG TPA: efflux RND transporter permease subunit, partial [Phycisphaerae bacterium]|nr:efflux RND transporter permease subunit [Phycisphaerae bacterium]